MKKYTMYVCETCGRESKDYNVIRECEAGHLGLTVDELNQYDKLNSDAEDCGRMVSIAKNDKTEKAFDDAIKTLVAFERKHGLIGKENE